MGLHIGDARAESSRISVSSISRSRRGSPAEAEEGENEIDVEAEDCASSSDDSTGVRVGGLGMVWRVWLKQGVCSVVGEVRKGRVRSFWSTLVKSNNMMNSMQLRWNG